jgi:hypothetical protein
MNRWQAGDPTITRIAESGEGGFPPGFMLAGPGLQDPGIRPLEPRKRREHTAIYSGRCGPDMTRDNSVPTRRPQTGLEHQ